MSQLSKMAKGAKAANSVSMCVGSVKGVKALIWCG